MNVTAGNWWTVYPGAAPVVNAIDTAMVTVLDKKILVADTWAYRWSRSWGSQPLMIQLSYENGYAHTTLSGAVDAGGSSISVATTIGIASFGSGIVTANQTPYLTILDGNQREDIVVTGISGTTLTLETELQYEHAAGTIVTGLPFDIQEWTIALAADLIKSRDVGSVTMDASGFKQNPGSDKISPSLLKQAKEGLVPYTRVGGA